MLQAWIILTVCLILSGQSVTRKSTPTIVDAPSTQVLNGIMAQLLACCGLYSQGRPVGKADTIITEWNEVAPPFNETTKSVAQDMAHTIPAAV